MKAEKCRMHWELPGTHLGEECPYHEPSGMPLVPTPRWGQPGSKRAKPAAPPVGPDTPDLSTQVGIETALLYGMVIRMQGPFVLTYIYFRYHKGVAEVSQCGTPLSWRDTQSSLSEMAEGLFNDVHTLGWTISVHT